MVSHMTSIPPVLFYYYWQNTLSLVLLAKYVSLVLLAKYVCLVLLAKYVCLVLLAKYSLSLVLLAKYCLSHFIGKVFQ